MIKNNEELLELIIIILLSLDAVIAMVEYLHIVSIMPRLIVVGITW